MGELTRLVDVCFLDKNKKICHTQVSLRQGTVMTYENIRTVLLKKIEQDDTRIMLDTKRLYEAVKAKYEENKDGGPLFEDLSPMQQKELGYSPDAFDYEHIQLVDILSWSLIQTV
jgi:hypothetical protein